MKKIVCLIVAAVLLFTLIPTTVFAESANLAVSVSNSSPSVGSDIVLTYTFTCETPFDVAQAYVNYDTSMLQFVSCSTTSNGTEGTTKVVAFFENTTRFSFTVTLKAKSGGSTTVTSTDGMISTGTAELSCDSKSATVNIGSASQNPQNQTSTNSKKADLKSLKVATGSLSPAFSSSVTSYNVTVNYKDNDGIIYVETVDPYAKIKIQGERDLPVGKSTRTVTVTGSDGSVKTYSVTFNRLDENGRDVAEPEPTDDITVEIGDYTYYLPVNLEGVEIPSGLIMKEFNYKDNEITALTDSKGEITVLYLTDSEGVGKFYLYEDNNFCEFKYYETPAYTYIFLSLPKDTEYEGFVVSAMEIDGQTVECLKYTDESLNDFVIVYALSPTGNKGYYKFDTSEGTFQRTNITAVQKTNGNKPVFSFAGLTLKAKLLLLFALLAVLLIVAIIVILVVFLVKRRRNNGFDDNDTFEISMFEDDDEQETEEEIVKTDILSDDYFNIDTITNSDTDTDTDTDTDN